MDVKILSPNRLPPPRPVRQPVPFWTIEVVGSLPRHQHPQKSELSSKLDHSI